jgi:hypothetical protein
MNLIYFNTLSKLNRIHFALNLPSLNNQEKFNVKLFGAVKPQNFEHNLKKYAYLFLLPVGITTGFNLNNRAGFFINRRYSNYSVSVGKFMGSLKRFLSFMEYLFNNNLQFLTLSPKFFKTVQLSLNNLSNISCTQLIGSSSPSFFHNKSALTRLRASIVKSMTRGYIDIILLLYHNSFSQLTHTLSAFNFFLLGLALNYQSAVGLSLSLPTNNASANTVIILSRIILVLKQKKQKN